MRPLPGPTEVKPEGKQPNGTSNDLVNTNARNTRAQPEINHSMDRAKSMPPHRSQSPVNKQGQVPHGDSKPWRELWTPTHNSATTTPSPLAKGGSEKPGLLKTAAIFLAFLCFFLSGAAGIAHWQTGLLGVANGPSDGKAGVLHNTGFQTFYYEAGQEIWIGYTTEIEEGFFNISIWTSDELLSGNIIETVFEHEVTQSETKTITWIVPQSGYYRIVFGTGNEGIPDLNGSVDRGYSAQYGIQRVPTYREPPAALGNEVESQSPALSEASHPAPPISQVAKAGKAKAASDTNTRKRVMKRPTMKSSLF